MAVQPITGEQQVPFGGYILLRRLAVGGMAEIFLARERGAGPEEFIVIKRLLGHISEHPGLVQMFLDEARIAATLVHSNIVKIYNVGTVGGHFFLSMEHLRGLDLSKLNREMRRQKRRLPVDRVLYVCHRICQALAYAHNHRGRKGEPLSIVHRDLSPHNVFLTLDGEVKLLDFGVAKAANALHKTKTGALVGKLAYMSPEHLGNNIELDGRSDLFSLGIIMWELSVGRRLYNTKKLGEFEVLRRITQERVPDPSHFDKSFPPVVKQILDRALRKDRDERYQSAAAFAKAIEAAAASLGFDLTRKNMAEFVNTNLPDVVARITSSIRSLVRTPITTANTPSLISSPSSSLSRSTTTSGEISLTLSASQRPTVAQVADFDDHSGSGSGSGTSGSGLDDFEDEERTERRIRKVQRVTWNPVPRPPPDPTPTKRPIVLPVVVLAILLVCAAISLLMILR